MAEAETETTQCKALTESGERCSRPARDDGFCYQHDESDQTVSDSQATEQEQEQGEQGDAQSVDMAAEERVDPEEIDADVDVDDDDIAGILSIRQTVRSTAGQLIGHEFEGVSEISPMDDGWRAVVEVVERSSIPDTQDIIGRYEIELDAEGTVQGYRRIDRYRRGDTAAFE